MSSYDAFKDPFWTHFGPTPTNLTDESRQSIDALAWTATSTKSSALGGSSLATLSLPSSSSSETGLGSKVVVSLSWPFAFEKTLDILSALFCLLQLSPKLAHVNQKEMEVCDPGTTYPSFEEIFIS